MPSAKALDGLKNRVQKPEDYHLFVTQQNFAVFGESTKNGEPSLEIASKALLAPILSCRSGFDAQMESESRWDNYRGETYWQRLRSRLPGQKK